jgi:predicted Zn-dependent protease
MAAMTFMLRRSRLAAAAFLALIALAAQGQPQPPAPLVDPAPPAAAPESAKAAPAQPSAMTADLFYEVLLGELSARSDPGAAYGLVLDAARRARDGKLFQRAVEIALQSRSGDSALEAARAWKDTMPESREARRFELQILIALNRIAETVEPLRAEIAATPQVERPFLMAVIARNYSRATDKKLAASVVEQALVDELANPATAGAAWATIGRLRLAAGDSSGALDAALKGQQLDPSSEGPALLALEIMDPSQPLAEPIVKRYLAGPKAQPEMRVGYARALVEGRRYAEASAELAALTAARPELPEPWLLLGSLQLQARQDKAAEASLNRFISLAPNIRDPEGRERGLTQAYLLMAQLDDSR